MSYWRTEYDDGWWTFYKDGIEIKFDNPNFGDLIVDEINNANLRIAELEAERRWIPVEERLPEKHECVLLLMKSKRYGVGVGIGHRLSSERHGWMVTYLPMPYDEITHWMPLPNPPEVNNE